MWRNHMENQLITYEQYQKHVKLYIKTNISDNISIISYGKLYNKIFSA
jgi:hypothetical protein